MANSRVHYQIVVWIPDFHHVFPRNSLNVLRLDAEKGAL
jgi:hypothetical protein